MKLKFDEGWNFGPDCPSLNSLKASGVDAQVDQSFLELYKHNRGKRLTFHGYLPIRLNDYVAENHPVPWFHFFVFNPTGSP